MKFLILFFLFFSVTSAQHITVTGRVTDAESGLPLEGANIVNIGLPETGTASDPEGYFELTFRLSDPDTLKISFVGYKTELVTVTRNRHQDLLIKLYPKIISSQTVLVEASMGKQGITPLAFNQIRHRQIEQDYTTEDIPEYLSRLPSTTFYSEGGSGIGYNYLNIRGFDQRRISVSINGIPQNDPEDHNVYWIDFPDLLAGTELIQVQRGAGSGVFGYPAIGGSINIITSTFANNPFFKLSSSYGSFNTKKFSVAYSSGLIKNSYSFYAKLSQTLTSGYRDMSWAKLNSYHFSAVRYDDNLTTQVNFYGGPLEDGLAYTGLPKFAVKDRDLRRANYSYWEAEDNQYTFIVPRRPEEKENFSQPHYELLNELNLSDDVTINSALFLVKGDGFFDYDASWADTTYFRLTQQFGFSPDSNPVNAIIRAQVENTQYGWIPRVKISHSGGVLFIGGEFRFHRSNHWGAINSAGNLPPGVTSNYFYYFYRGAKDIINGFINETYSVSDRINLLGEFQIAYHKYRLYDEKYVGNDFSISDIFFNPRLGINYKISDQQNLYLSFSRVTREPRLKNYYDAAESSGGEVPQFRQNPDGTYDFNSPLVNPETMNDIEFGTEFHFSNFDLSFNLFYMLFDDEIVKNGQLDRFGQPVTGNVDKTTHQGVELALNGKMYDHLSLFLNATYSRNLIDRGRFYIDSENYITLDANSISGFPEWMANFGLSYTRSGVFLQISGRYVGDFYSDNYDDNLGSYLFAFPGFVNYNDNVNDAYFTADFFGSYQFNLFNSLSPSKIFLEVKNIFDNLYSAYAVGGEFFPAAERNFLAGFQIGL